MFIVRYPIEFSRLHNLHPWYWNTLLYGLISSGKNSAHFLQPLPFPILHFLFHQVSITAGWTEAELFERLAQHLYTWPAVRLEHRSPIQVLTGLGDLMRTDCHTAMRYRSVTSSNYGNKLANHKFLYCCYIFLSSANL